MENTESPSNGFVPLVTVVGFHHARYAAFYYSFVESETDKTAAALKSRAGLAQRRGLTPLLTMNGHSSRLWL